MQAFPFLHCPFSSRIVVLSAVIVSALVLDGFGQSSAIIPSIQTPLLPLVPQPQMVPQSKVVVGVALDISKYPPDVWNCEVCRQRLGLPPLHSDSGSTETRSSHAIPPSHVVLQKQMHAPKLIPVPMAQDTRTDPMSGVRMLGSPGLISSGTAAKMATEGLVVEEFIPPKPEQGAIQLNGIPLEVRQQFMQNLDLPFGAKVMSANVLGQDVPTFENATPATEVFQPPKPSAVQSNTESTPSSKERGALGIVERAGDLVVPNASEAVSRIPPRLEVPAEAAISPPPEIRVEANTDAAPVSPITQLEKFAKANADLQTRFEEAAQLQAKKQAESERALKEEMSRLGKERQKLVERVAQMHDQQQALQEEWQRRIAQADAANKEALIMLERRTAEVTELQAKLKQQSKGAGESKPAPKKSDKKKASDKEKEDSNQPTKPSIDT